MSSYVSGSTLAGAAVAAAAVVGASLYVCSRKSDFKATGLRVADLPPGTMKEVSMALEGDAKGTILLAHTTTGAITATSSKCPHYGASLVKGVLAGDRIVCPWHAACFSATTGDIEDGPVVDKLATYKTKVAADGQILVEIPKGTTAVPSKGVAPRTCKHDPAADTRTFVIIGGGAAALAAIESLREHGYAGRIVLVSKESTLPYDRPKLSKNMALTPADVTLRNADWFARLGVELRLGETVTEVRPASRQVALAGGALLAYDKLLCCSGGYPRRFVAPERFVTPGADLRNVFPLRDLAHAQGIEAAIDAAGGPAACPVVIVGSSFIGMEAAAYLKANKGVASVTVIGMEAVPFERVLGREIGGYMEAMHRGRGVQFRLPATVAEFRPSAADAGAVGSVVLKSGEVLPAGVVIIGAGIIPSTEYLAGEEAKAAGIEVLAGAPGGVKVNAQLQTGCPDVFAAGDLAYFPYTPRGAAAPLWTRIEHWDVAYDQGRTAGRNMVGEGVAYGAVPFFWTQSYGKSLRYAGHCHGYDRLVVHGSLAPGADGKLGAFTAYYCAGDAVAAVATVDRDPQGVAALELLRLGAMPAPAALAGRESFDLVEFLRATTRDAAAVGAGAGSISGAAAGGVGVGAAAGAGAAVSRRKTGTIASE